MNKQSKKIRSKVKSNQKSHNQFSTKTPIFLFFPNGLKISFLTNLTMLYPNL
jgi:hypothetical protein